VLMAKMIPVYAHRDALRAFVQAPRQALSRLPPTLTDDGRVVVDPTDPAAIALDLAGWRGALAGESFGVSPSNERALAELERIAEERSLRVVIANGPLAETATADPDLKAYRLERDRQFRRRFGRGAVRYLDWQGVYDETQMESVDHLAGEAPRAYSLALAAQLTLLLDR